ncbi:MAG: hypothetical protein KDD75_03350, partial [Caldilineaceae bacterium]|nr:hypothetical protein [Caldilineaceae bacterium]
LAAWGDRSKRYDDLTLELTRLGAHANAAEVLDRLAAMLSSADRKAVEQAVVECKEAAEANVVRRADFIALAGRLQLHHDFLIGVALVERPNRTSREEADGLELLERVVYGQDVDRDRAQAIIARVKADVSRAQARKAAIDKATEMRSQKRFKDAHQVLLEYRNDPEIAPLLVQNAEEWEKVLVAQVMTTLMRAPLDCRGARDLISDLETVGSREVGKLRSLVEGRCAEQRASVLEKEPGDDQDEIVQIWQDALASDPDNPMYKQRLRVASKRRDYSRNQEKVDPAEKAEAMRLMTKQYAGDLEVQVWYIDALVDLVSKQTEYVQVEEAAQRTEEALQVTMQQMVSAGADDGMRRGLEERRRKITRMKDIARRKHDIVLELKPDKQLEAWLRAKSEGAKLVNDFEDELAIRTWWERTRQYAFRDAESRLSHSGGDVWKELQPAAQMLALDGDNNTARTVLQKANRAIMDFPQQLRLAVNDTTGASYAGEARNKLDQQILAATDLRNNMMLARDILTTFGGVFDNAVDLKDQVSGYINQTTELIARLEDVRKQIHQGYAAIDQARSTEGAWYAYDQAQQRLEKLGYSQHLTVLEMDREKREVQGKQRNLKTVRENLVKAVRDSRTDEALRFAQQMVGAPPDVIAERKHLQVTVQDLRADPTDEFGEQRRIEVVEPFSGERFTALPELVRHLLRQSQQAAMILQWLPTNPTDTEDQVRIQVVSWPVVKAEASETAKAGKFDQARAQIEQAIDGDAQGNVGERLSLGAAVRYLNNPPVTREKLL